MADNINKVIQRTFRYFYEDGLVEMALGLLFIAVGLLLYLWQGVTSPTISGLMLAIGLPLLIIGVTLLFRRIIKELKERITFPRTGYVSYREKQPDNGRWLVMGVALALVILVIFLPDTFNRMQLMVGVLLGTVLIYTGYRVSVWRFYLIGALAILLGVGLTLLEMEEVLAVALVFLTAGLVMFISGAVVLVAYLRSHPRQQDMTLSEGS